MLDDQAHFAGCRSELAALSAALESAHHGRGRIALLAGDPGIGKTRLADELSAMANRQGDLVLWGRCHEGDGASAFWPWVQIIRAYAESRDLDTLRAELRASATDLIALVPEIQDRLPEIQLATPIQGEQARFRLFDSLSSMLIRVSRTQPLILILDDLHWADQPSLLLERHLAYQLTSSRILLIATYRESDAVLEAAQMREVREALLRAKFQAGQLSIDLYNLREQVQL